MQVIDEKDTTHKSEIYRKIGLCYKKLGSFENARQCLAEANKLLPNQAPVLADLADCYALCGEDKGAKVAEFVRFENGEGIEKAEENFAEEVMKQINK